MIEALRKQDIDPEAIGLKTELGKVCQSSLPDDLCFQEMARWTGPIIVDECYKQSSNYFALGKRDREDMARQKAEAHKHLEAFTIRARTTAAEKGKAKLEVMQYCGAVCDSLGKLKRKVIYMPEYR